MGKQLIPSLEKDDVVIMDNMRSHHAKIVTELLDKAGISYLYLPPYSPDLNPIEKMWSKMKSFLRKRKVRVAAELSDAVKAALETISTNDCKVGSTHLEFALIKRIAIIMAQIETDKKVRSFHRLRYKQMLMLEKSWFYNRTSFFVYSWTNGVPVL